MKIIAFLCVSLLCFCQYSGNAGNAQDNRQTDAAVNRAPGKVNAENNLAPAAKKGDLKINVYQNNKLAASYIYDKNVFQEAVFPNADDNGKAVEDNPILKDFADKTAADNLSYYEFLASKNIKIPFPEPISGKISDTAQVLTLLEDDSEEIKKETSVNAGKKTLKFTSINDFIRLYPSEIPSSVTRTEKLKNYELVLADDYLHRETFQFQKSRFIREYFYEEDRLIKLVSTSVINGKTKSEEIRFEYEKLNPNQNSNP